MISGVLSSEELRAFTAECCFHRSILKDTDLSNLGAAIDIFEDSQLPDSDKRRVNPDAYFTERSRNYPLGVDDYQTIRHFLTSRLPSFVCNIYLCEELHIFNESYIVKDPKSQIAFRWHTDSNEQLGAIPIAFRPKYYSAWCPLDDTNAGNGTLAFPTGTKVIYLQLNDDPSHSYEPMSNSPTISLCKRSTLSTVFVEPEENDDGLLINVKAGSVVLFSSNTWHRSGDNNSSSPRRVLYVQYSDEIISASTGASVAAKAQSSGSVLSKAQRTDDHAGNKRLNGDRLDSIGNIATTECLYREIARSARSSGSHKSPSGIENVRLEYPLCFAVPCSSMTPLSLLAASSRGAEYNMYCWDPPELSPFMECTQRDSCEFCAKLGVKRKISKP